MFKFITKWWNILIGKDKNRDGQVDIKDDMIRAKEKSKRGNAIFNIFSANVVTILLIRNLLFKIQD